MESFDRFICQEQCLLLSAGELVAERADGYEAVRRRAEFLAQYEDVLVECPGRPIVGESPAGVEKFVS